MLNDYKSTKAASCFGHCRDCGTTHRLPAGNAKTRALELMREFEELQRLDYLAKNEEADPRLSFTRLLPGDRSHMFGVLECRDERGGTVVLRAFSSLRGGVRNVDGWVPQILSTDAFYGTVQPGLDKIHEMTRELEKLAPDSAAAHDLVKKRKRSSQDLWRSMEALYRFHNFRGESRSLRDAFTLPPGSERKIPSGVGECCAPKLLNYAALEGLTPVGLAEFYWGDTNESGERKPGDFYPSCEARCQPILGFMLCGITDES